MNMQRLDFSSLVQQISRLDKQLLENAVKAVNTSLTLRNWCIGAYIREYELNGKDRAAYGESLFTELAKQLSELSNCNKRQLYRYLRFYNFYPQIAGTLSPQLHPDASVLLNRLSYSHFDLLVGIVDETKRAFYEIETVQANWSVRELKRQINSLYYERSGLSHNKTALARLAGQSSEQQTVSSTIKDPYVLSF